jgi:hypothetical protein
MVTKMTDLKDLDEVVLDALDLHASYDLPQFNFPGSENRLAVASGNALPTAKIVLDDGNTTFCDEGHYETVLEGSPEIDLAVVISASGTKHAPIIVGDLMDRGVKTFLLTCNRTSPAAQLLPAEQVFETQSVPEPITYNTSTYLGMILAGTREDPTAIKKHLIDEVAPRIRDMDSHDAFYLIVPPEYDMIREMFLTKFDELFSGRVNGRCYTSEQTSHAKTVVPWDREQFIGLGYENQIYGGEEHRLNIPLPANASYAAMIATGYFVIGHIQKRFPPWFKEHADEYKAIQEAIFAQMTREREQERNGA